MGDQKEILLEKNQHFFENYLKMNNIPYTFEIKEYIYTYEWHFYDLNMKSKQFVKYYKSFSIEKDYEGGFIILRFKSEDFYIFLHFMFTTLSVSSILTIDINNHKFELNNQKENVIWFDRTWEETFNDYEEFFSNVLKNITSENIVKINGDNVEFEAILWASILEFSLEVEREGGERYSKYLNELLLEVIEPSDDSE